MLVNFFVVIVAIALILALAFVLSMWSALWLHKIFALSLPLFGITIIPSFEQVVLAVVVLGAVRAVVAPGPMKDDNQNNKKMLEKLAALFIAPVLSYGVVLLVVYFFFTK